VAGKIVSGIAVSSGITIGKAYFLNRSRFKNLPRQTILPWSVDDELMRLSDAFGEAEAELEAIRAKVPPELRENALIIDSHVMILKDPKLRGQAEKFIRELCINAEWALEKSVEELHSAFSALQDPYIRERMEDVRMVSQRVLAVLLGAGTSLTEIKGRVVLMAHDLSPADTMELELDKIMGLATVSGAKTSHSGIMARSLRIPAIVGASALEESVSDGDLVVIDGLSGKILVHPEEQELEYYHELNQRFEQYQKANIRFCHLPAETRDGYRVNTLANIELFEEVAQVLDNGGEGVGLYRTEFSYMNRKDLPDEDELYEEYRDLASIMAPHRLTIRTLDLGADKLVSQFGALDEANPALGLRAIRFCMSHPEVFTTQLKAILRAAAHGNVSVMFPMISGTRELQYAKALLEEAREKLTAEKREFRADLPVGIMMEVPSAVMIAEILAQEVDFFSIGTNDLIQYALGIDRTNRHVSHLYQPLHPAIVRMIKYVVDAAHKVGIEVSVCGEMAADPFCVPILMGMQVDALSLGPQAIPGIKQFVRRASMNDCKALLKRVLESPSVGQTNRLVKESIEYMQGCLEKLRG
jgi:phosphotransferase system enzyme I (PtsI)